MYTQSRDVSQPGLCHSSEKIPTQTHLSKQTSERLRRGILLVQITEKYRRQRQMPLDSGLKKVS